MTKIIEVKERIIQDNNAVANQTREVLKEKNIFFVNLMASPGAGKTTLLTKVLPILKEKYRIGVIEADVDSDVDAKTMESLGIKALQVHTAGLCHMDADMTKRSLDALGLEDIDVIVLENIGNLVCPAEFDTGAHLNMMILSVPEGDDKPLKYPLMFQNSQFVVVNKIDVKEVFDFNDAKFENNVRLQNENCPIYYVSSKTGEGIEKVGQYIMKCIEEYRNHENN